MNLLTSVQYIITTPNNLIAATLIIRYWFDQSGYDGPGKSPAIYIAILLATIIAINYFGVGIFGEFEFWLSSFKILVLLGLIIFTLVLAAGGGPKPATGFTYWNDPGAFAPFKASEFPHYPTKEIDSDRTLAGGAGKFLGFWNVLTNAVFSFLGAELVGICAAEAANPRKAIPTAVKLTFFRIVFFYLVLILFLGMTVPYNSDLLLTANSKSDTTVSADASPFVVAAKIAGVNGIPSVINAFLLVFTFSAANSDCNSPSPFHHSKKEIQLTYDHSIHRNTYPLFSRNRRQCPSRLLPHKLLWDTHLRPRRLQPLLSHRLFKRRHRRFQNISIFRHSCNNLRYLNLDIDSRITYILHPCPPGPTYPRFKPRVREPVRHDWEYYSIDICVYDYAV